MREESTAQRLARARDAVARWNSGKQELSADDFDPGLIYADRADALADLGLEW
jgi:hypothetical protein